MRIAGRPTVTRYVIGPDVAVHLAAERVEVRGDHELLAPALLRSQVLSLLYRAVQRGELTDAEARRRLDDVRRLKMRLLGDRVLQDVAWRVAAQLRWPDTADAEYVALTQLQADALVTLDERLAHEIGGLVPLAPVEALSAPH